MRVDGGGGGPYSRQSHQILSPPRSEIFYDHPACLRCGAVWPIAMER
jgi:hypothetical protein